jgi:hypothetical protein
MSKTTGQLYPRIAPEIGGSSGNTFRGYWDNATAYNATDYTVFHGNIYQATAANTNQEPVKLYSETILEAAPVLYMPFNESTGATVVEQLGSYGQATVPVSYGTFVQGPSLTSGMNSYQFAYNGSSPILTGNSGWYPPASGFSIEIIGKFNAGDGVLSSYNVPQGGFFLWLSGGQIGFGTINTGSYDALYSGGNIADGASHAVALVWDGTNRKIYIDGHQVAQDSPTRNAYVPPISGADLVFGRLSDNRGPQPMAGAYADFALYHRVLSDTEILNHYNAYKLPSASASWTKFN